MAKVKVEVGGEFTGMQAFEQASNSVKKLGRDHKDMASIATNSLQTVSNEFGKVGKAAGLATGALQGLISGGLWGMIAAGAASAFSTVVRWIKDVKKATEEAEKAIRMRLTDSIKKLKDDLTGIGDNAREATQDINDMVKIAQGQMANNARLKVAEVSTKALQSMTDDMTEAGRKVIKAQSEIEKQSIKYASTVQQLEQTQKGLEVKQTNLGLAYQNASRLVVEMENKRAQFLNQNGSVIARYTEACKNGSKSMEEVMETLKDENEARRWLVEWKKEQQKIEREHGDILKADVESQKNLQTAHEQEEKLLKEKETVERQLSEVVEQQKIAAEENTTAELELAQALKDAEKAHRKETEAAERLMQAELEEEQYLIEQEAKKAEAEEINRQAELGKIGVELRNRDAAVRGQVNALNQIQNRINGLNAAIQRGTEVIEEQNRGMEADRRVAGGWNGNNPYQYQSMDENGILVDPVEQDRARRYAGRAERDRQNRDKDYYTVGNEERADKIRNDIKNGNATEKDQKWLGNYEQKQQQAQQRIDELEKKQKDGKRLSNQEQKELDRWKKNKDAVDKKKNEQKLKKAEEDKQKLIGDIKTNTDAIKTLLETATKLQ